MLDTHARKYADPIIDNVARYLIKLGLKPNEVTKVALIFGIASALFIYFGFSITGIAMLWVSGLLDAVDGAMARRLGKSSAFGALMDIVFDRIVEISIILTLGLLYSEARFLLMVLLASIIISMTIFLTVGAVAQNSGKKTFYYQAGLAERTEGFIMLSFMTLLPSYLSLLTAIFAAMILYTALQRILEAGRIMKASEGNN